MTNKSARPNTQSSHQFASSLAKARGKSSSMSCILQKLKENPDFTKIKKILILQKLKKNPDFAKTKKKTGFCKNFKKILYFAKFAKQLKLHRTTAHFMTHTLN